jgi:hypothetical protein
MCSSLTNKAQIRLQIGIAHVLRLPLQQPVLMTMCTSLFLRDAARELEQSEESQETDPTAKQHHRYGKADTCKLADQMLFWAF